MWVAFANAKATHFFFSKNISIYAIFNDKSFNDTLTNNILSFEQLGQDCIKCTDCSKPPLSSYTSKVPFLYDMAQMYLNNLFFIVSEKM